MNIVGTHWEWVMPYLWMVSSAPSASKRGMMTAVPPRAIVVMTKRSGAAW